jgi:hypothetical protein
VFATIDHTLTANVETLVLQGPGNLAGPATASPTNSSAIPAITPSTTGRAPTGSPAMPATTPSCSTPERRAATSSPDFAGNGAVAGDSLKFIGLGTTLQGATFTEIGATNQWVVHSGLGHPDETITLLNGASVDATDLLFT